jgi:hypothetical protein
MKKLILILTVLSTISCNGQEQKEYSSIIKEIIEKRDSLMLEYSESDSIGQDSIIVAARDYLINTMTKEIFPCWYGTKWDFNGTTRTPQNGRISCGYFVTNILTDIGFKIPRVKWAQSASEVFITKLSFGKIDRFSNKPILEIEKYLKKSGNGLYLVGLDCHTGFVFVNSDEIRFIHADYYEPENGVVSEKINSNSPIADSKYRVFGKLMSDEMIINWILNIEMK